MKDHRFIELLNLYVDRQITAAETVELEAEIQQNLKRQAVYRQYCQIHTASKLVYDSFRANAPEQAALHTARAGQIEPFETKRGKYQFGFYAAGLAAAACLALVFVRFNSVADDVSPLITAKSDTREVVLPTASFEVVPVRAAEQPVGLVSLRNSTTMEPDYSAMLAALREQDEERAFASGHLQSDRVQSLFDDGVFNAKRPVSAQDPRLFRVRPAPAQQAAEFTAFQFQR